MKNYKIIEEGRLSISQMSECRGGQGDDILSCIGKYDFEVCANVHSVTCNGRYRYCTGGENFTCPSTESYSGGPSGEELTFKHYSM